MTSPDQLSLSFDAVPRTVEEVVHAFEQNIVLRAGAGTGKTEQLTSLYAHLVAGATSFGRPVSPQRIVAITFTEKAAGEMRERIGRVLRALGRPGGPDRPRIAAVVEATLTASGRTVDPARFAEALEALPTARIATIHSLCASLLRAHPAEAGLDPGFSVLSEGSARELFEEAAVVSVRERVVDGDDAVADLVRDLGGMRGPNERGVVPLLALLHAELAESGRPPDALLTGTPYTDAGHDQELDRVCRVLGLSPTAARAGKTGAAFETLVVAHERMRGLDLHPKTATALARAAVAATSLRRSPSFGSDDAGALACAVGAIEDTLQTSSGKAAAASVSPGAEVREAALELWALPRRRARALAIVRLVTDTARRYAEGKRARGALDFADLTLGARDLLRDHAELRRDVVHGIDALLVDELQDTNAVQRDLVHLLHARDEVGCAVPGWDQLRPRGLFVVGDRKQSIYGFRNADVAVFEEVADHVVRAGGRELALTTSWRSIRPLVEATNALASQALAPESAEPERFEIEYDALREALSAAHDAHHESPPTELLVVDDPDPDAEPRAVAARVAELVRSPDAPPVRDAALGTRRPRAGDVALLLPRFTNLAAYLRALDDLGVPYVVVRGRGLMQTVEARDVVALGRVLADSDDGRGIAAVLRGPFATLSDATLLRIAGQLGRAGFRTLLSRAPRLGDGVPDDERARYDAAVALLARLRAAVGAIGLANALSIAIAESGYAAVLAALPGGAQRVANVDRLVAEIAARERAGEDGRRALADLVRRSDEEIDREADVASEGADAVRVMTVHQAKGLEFPIVVAADLGRRIVARKSSVEHDRHPRAGLAVAVRAPWGAWIYSRHHDDVHRIRERREAAERMRLFYVQITRACDRLVLVGRPASNSVMTRVVELLARGLSRAGLLAVVEPSAEPTGDPTEVGPPRHELDLSLVRELEARSRASRPNVRELEVPVTVLEDFALCPRRYRARHVLRLPEHPAPRAPASPELDVEGDDAGDAGADPRRRGTLAHAILERLDLARAAEEPARALAAAMRAVRAPPSDDLVARLSPFVAGDYVRELAGLGDERVSREVPFSLAVDAGAATLVLRGQIDLLVDAGDHVDVVDYKVTAPRGADATAPYRFQLGCYAAAVRRMVGPTREVRTWVQFLDGRSHLPVLAPPAPIEDDLPSVGGALVEAHAAGHFKGSDRGHCDAIACGYRWLCWDREAEP